jgi:hypothetical protein
VGFAYFGKYLNLWKVQVFADSRVTIDWENDMVQLQVVRVHPLLAQIGSLLSSLEWFSFAHIYRELNTLAYELSKEALELEKGSFLFQEFFDGHISEDMSFLL